MDNVVDNVVDMMSTPEVKITTMSVVWRERVMRAMLREGIDIGVASDLINGVIDDVIRDERDDARAEGAADERRINSEY